MAIKSEFCQAPECEKLRDKKRGSAYCMMHRSRRSRFKSTELPEKEKLPEGIIKICFRHGELNENQVYRVPGKTWIQCKRCKEINVKTFYNLNPGYVKTKNYIFVGSGKHRFRISISDYEKMHILQNGLCAICNQSEDSQSNHQNVRKTKRLAIDHCHDSKKVRELLCQKCNIGLGAFGDSIEKMRAAIAYLDKHKIRR